MAAVLLLAAPLSAFGQGPAYDFYASLSSDYIWRGISQTRHEPALQGGFDVSLDSGPYLGVWASNVDFPSASGHRSATEVDYNGGISFALVGDWSLDVGAMRYTYLGVGSNVAPSSSEFYVGVGNGSLGAKAWYSRSAGSWYLEGNLDWEFPGQRALLLHLGNYRFRGQGSYSDWSIGLRQNWSQHIYTSISYSHTTLSAQACTALAGEGDLCSPRWVLAVGGSF